MQSGGSKAKKLRQFWSIEPDEIVGPVLMELIEHAEATTNHHEWEFRQSEDKKEEREQRQKLVDFCKDIASRLCTGSQYIQELKNASQPFDSDYISRQIVRMNSAVSTDPDLAIGTAKELIETCCKTILTKEGHPLPDSPKLSKLTKETFKLLQLTPEDVPDSRRGNGTIKLILQNLATIGHNIAELRNMYGTGHGKAGSHSGLTARHAKLATGAAATLVIFLFETYADRNR